MISAKTRMFGVVGDPVAHSLSPRIHNRWLSDAGIDAVYTGYHLRSGDAAADLRALARAGVSGLNITLPHKAAALAAADEVSDNAARVGAANTLERLSGGGWRAHNTDVEGFAQALAHACPGDLAGRRVVLIGAGGASRAAVVHLVHLGADLAIVNRTPETAAQLAADLAPGARSGGLDQLEALAHDAAVIVNAASFGHSSGAPPDMPSGGGRPFLDMSYGAAAVESFAAARKAGWTPHDGLRMLVAQAAAAFGIWFGVTPDAERALADLRLAAGQ
jgi:shikimate dehydrogenase